MIGDIGAPRGVDAAQDVPAPPPPSRFNFFHFDAVFGKILAKK